MIGRKYHYLISGLPDLSMKDPKNLTPAVNFRDMLEKELHPTDYEQVKIVFLKDDHANLIRFLLNQDEMADSAGNFNHDDFRDQVSIFSAILPGNDILPGYMVDLMRNILMKEEEFDPVKSSHHLAEGYYGYVMEKGSHFMKEWTEFDYNISNLLAFLQSSKYGLDQKRFITADNSLTRHLKQYVSRSLISDPDFDLFEEVVSISEMQTFAEAEYKFDRLKWKVIDEYIFFEDFSIDWILGYVNKLLLALRWKRLSQESGETIFRELIQKAKNEAFSVPVQELVAAK